MSTSWRAPNEVRLFVDDLIEKHHPHLMQAKVAVGFDDSKIFRNGRFNWGKVSKFSKLTKLWQAKNEKYDFCIVLCSDAWHQFLTEAQREAWLDLCLCRCQVEYEPACIEKNGKKTVVKDEWGRTEYTNEIKYDDEGDPVWKVAPLDIVVFAQNVKRYGLWCEPLVNFQYAIEKKELANE